MNNFRKRPASLFESTTPAKKCSLAPLEPLQANPPPARPSRTHLNFSKGLSRTNDDIHSSIDICPVVKALLDSRPLQRLRGVQQLATAQYVYVNCTHNRLEHSLGVSHLASLLCRRIAQRQPNLKTTPKDVLCVQLAGLLHDIGHGPFSHTYEDFLKKELPEYCQRHPELQQHYEGVPDIPEHYQHEDTSLKLIDAALESRGLRINLDQLDEPLEEIETGSYRLFAETMHVYDDKTAVLTSRDWVFIKECIWGGPVPHINQYLGLPEHQFVGRPHRHQEWLYDIVSNRHSGLDVDKIDYYARDHRAAMKGSGEFDKPMILEAVVAWGASTDSSKCQRRQQWVNENKENQKKKEAASGEDAHRGQHLMICYPQKVVGPAMNFFKQRHYLHKNIYRHRKTDAVSHMVCDILSWSDPFFRLHLPSGATLPLSRAMLDTEAFLRLRDSVLDMIANTSDPNLQKARDLIRRLEEGDLYKCVAEQRIQKGNPNHDRLWKIGSGGYNKSPQVRESEIKEELVREAQEANYRQSDGLCLTVDDIIVDCCSIHCGKKEKNPLSRMRFLQKEQLGKLEDPNIDNLPVAKEEPEANYEADIPRSFCENSIRLFCRTPQKAEHAAHVFHQWLKNHTQTTPPPAESKKPRSRIYQMISPGPLQED